MSRFSVIRKMNGVQHAVPCMQYPYGYIGRDEHGCDYALEDILRPIMVETEMADAGNFPENIAEHYWIRPGRNDGDSWMSCGVLSNGNYFFYSGGCDYTGFGCQGGMNLWVSSSWATIVEHAMNQSDYETFMDQTAVPPAEGEGPWPVLTQEEFWAECSRHTPCYECRTKGATHKMPYMDDEMLCDKCWAERDGEEEGGVQDGDM